MPRLPLLLLPLALTACSPTKSATITSPPTTSDLIPLSPDDRAADLSELTQALRETYSHLDTKKRQWGVDLDTLEKRYAPLARRADTWDRFERVMVAFTSELHDAHVAWRRPRAPGERHRRIVRLGLDSRFLDGALILTEIWPSSGAELAGLRVGDRIVGVAGESIEARLGDLSSLRSWSRREAAFYDFAEEWPAERVDADAPLVPRQVTRQLDDGGYQTLPVIPETAPPPGRKKEPIVLERSGDAWLLYIRSLGGKPADQALRLDTIAARLFTDPRGLIIDLRGNSGGYDEGAKEVASHLASGNVVGGSTRIRLSARARADRPAWRDLPEDPTRPGWSHPQPVEIQGRSRIRYAPPIAVLVDAGCRSACETLALLLRAQGAHLIGERTGGSSGAPVTFALRRSGARVTIPAWATFDASDRPIEGYGVPPDEEVLTTRADLLAKRDPPLDRALAYVKTPAAPPK